MPKQSKSSAKRTPKTGSKPVTLLLTGFDAFAGDKRNPSQLVVESFPDILKSKARGPNFKDSAKEIHICKQVLPTTGARGWKILKKALDSTLEQAEGPVMVLMLGLAAVRQTLSLERFAMNFRDYRVPDNNGEQRLEETIEAKAPQLLRSSLDLPQLQELLNTAGFPSEVSNHAGTFVCNELYFRALNYKREVSEIDSVLFVHLPLEKVFAKSAKKARTKNTPKELNQALKGITKAGKSELIALLREAVIEIVENIVHQTVSHPAARRK